MKCQKIGICANCNFTKPKLRHYSVFPCVSLSLHRILKKISKYAHLRSLWSCAVFCHKKQWVTHQSSCWLIFLSLQINCNFNLYESTSLVMQVLRVLTLIFPSRFLKPVSWFWGLWCRSPRPPLPLLLATHTKDGCSSGQITSRVISGGGLSWAMGCCHTTGTLSYKTDALKEGHSLDRGTREIHQHESSVTTV